MSAKPCRLRLSPALRALVDAASPNASAAQRALLLLGASLVGYDLSACRADLGRLLGEVGPRVRDAINVLYGFRGQDVGFPPHNRPTAGPQLDYTRPTVVPLSAHEPIVDAAPALSESSFRSRDEHEAVATTPDTDDDPFASVGIDV